MDAKTGEFKRKLLDTGLFRMVSRDGQYKCKMCPFCGDTKNHLYVLIRQGDDSPVLYNCFKCGAGGTINEEFLSFFGIDDIQIPRFGKRKKLQPGGPNVQSVELFNEETDGDWIEVAKAYIKSRVDVIPTNEELKMFQWIANPWDYVRSYLGGDERGLKNRLWFRMTNGAIIGRSLDLHSDFRWKKYNGDVRLDKGLYTIKKQFDLYQTVNVCIVEGVMDAIGLYYLNPVGNTVFIACMGKDYAAGIRYVLDMGIFGDSVQIKIFKDADVDHVRIPKQYRLLFKDISVYQNANAKDYGIPADKITIEKCLED